MPLGSVSESFHMASSIMTFSQDELGTRKETMKLIAHFTTTRFAYVTLAMFGLMLTGCGSPDARFRLNSVYVKKQEQSTGIELTSDQKRDVVDILAGMFGTPDDPHLPALADANVNAVVSEQRLKMAAGRVFSDQDGKPHGLYREHCAHCHGVTGDGAGPTAAFLNPYPRDYRRGIFKFKSTAGPTTPPTHDDLKRVLINGIPGTAMPSFRLLADDELEALVQYVKYLAIRGDVERQLIYESVDQLEENMHLVDLALKGEDPAEFASQLDYIKELTADVVNKWADAESEVTEVPARPTGWDMEESIAKGRELFYGNVANCVKCHGALALGDGQTTDYDEWTKEIFDPKEADKAYEYVALGALKPRNIRPRNLRQGIYRGGRRPVDIYWRIHNGIAGSPMPAAPMKPEGAGPEDKRLTPDDIWHLVDYVRNLPYESISQPRHADDDDQTYQRERL